MIEIHSQITCPPSGNKCAAQITTDGKKCLTPCEGVYADVTKLEAKNISGDHFESLLRNYNNYKRFFDISKSKQIKSKRIFSLMSHLIGMQIPAKLKYVKIFFDTPTFDYQG